MRISAAAAECTERIATMTRPLRRIKGSALVYWASMLPPPSKFLYGCGRTTHPVGGEPDSAGSIPERDADGVAAARTAVVERLPVRQVRRAVIQSEDQYVADIWRAWRLPVVDELVRIVP